MYLRAIFQLQTPGGGAYIWRGDLTDGFLCHRFGGLIFGGAYFRSFTVFSYWAGRILAGKGKSHCVRVGKILLRLQYMHQER